jgi:hypothetical protein
MNMLKTEFKTQKTKADDFLTKSQTAMDVATREQTEKTNVLNTLDSQLKTQVAARDQLLATYRDWRTKDSIANAITEPVCTPFSFYNAFLGNNLLTSFSSI